MQHWAITDAGCVRSQNQDMFATAELDKDVLLCLVCDGMGGARAGNVASELASEVFVQEMRKTWKAGMEQAQIHQIFLSAVKLANLAVYDKAKQFEEFSGMGTTLVAALICGRDVTIANVGDSRAYIINNGGIRRITRDHSLVEVMVQCGELSAEEARTYPGKNYITRAIGTEAIVECDLFHVDAERGDWLMLCSDGLTNILDDQEILFEVVHEEQKELCCERLVDIVKSRGAPDNVTCVLTRL